MNSLAFERITILFVFIVFFNQESYSQIDSITVKQNNKLIISLSGGVTIPLGKFSKFEVNDGTNFIGTNIAGAAQIGYNDRFNVAYLFSKNFGLNFTIFSTSDKAAQPDSADLFYCPGCHALGAGNTLQSYSYHSTNWLTNGFLLGFIIAFHSDNTSLVLRINPGLQKVQTPKTDLHEDGFDWRLDWPTTYSYTSDEIQSSIPSKYNFAFGGGMDMMVEFKNNLGIIISMDYLSSKASFNGDITHMGYSAYSQSTFIYKYPFSFDKNFSLFNFNLGIAYFFKSSAAKSQQ